MADIKTLPLLRHLRAEPTAHVLRYKRGHRVSGGPGLTFWFRGDTAAVAELPVDDRELPFLFHARTADYQDLAVQGVISFRVADPERLAARVDFTLDLRTGHWTQAPLERLAGLLTQLAQQLVVDDLMRRELRAILADGVTRVRDRIAAGLAAEPALADLGIAVVAVRVANLAPASDVAKALQQPAREAIQQRADEATFARRAEAVDKERAIAENELGNRTELARREEALIAHEAANADERAARAARREADAIDTVQAARLRAERDRAGIHADTPTRVLLLIALRELAQMVLPARS
jgi:regulator of protease activity HflC (stomatin/prohibitin superfamily)